MGQVTAEFVNNAATWAVLQQWRLPPTFQTFDRSKRIPKPGPSFIPWALL
uniref:Uncharacterized protein n=1 Tax=viral metagenome TaxID=1070528 RepID=A0A6M3MB53_9ZZZZ